KTITKWTCQVAKQLRVWIPSKKIIIIADSAFATYALANTCIDLGITLISRMRLDARTFDFPSSSKSGRGRKRLVGKRLPTFKEMIDNPLLVWDTTEMAWYGGVRRKIKTLSGT